MAKTFYAVRVTFNKYTNRYEVQFNTGNVRCYKTLPKSVQRQIDSGKVKITY